MNLYDPLLERDVDGIRAATREYRRDHTSDELFQAVARFALLAYSPSQHGKHAVISCLSAHELRGEAGERYDDLLTECAIYAASARQPWSEPPMTDPPALDGDEPDEPRLRAERWLARRLDTRDFAHEYFTAAADDFEDFGHKLIVAVTAWKLASIFAQQGRYASLRIGVWEMTAYHGQRYEERGNALDTEPLFERLIDHLDANGGDIISAHAIFLLAAALQAGDERVLARVRDYLSGVAAGFGRPDGPDRLKPVPTQLPIYRLARDYGALLEMHAVARRLRALFPGLNTDRMLAAAQYNLDHAPSFEEFSFA
jgi:hypothetical protein